MTATGLLWLICGGLAVIIGIWAWSARTPPSMTVSEEKRRELSKDEEH